MSKPIPVLAWLALIVFVAGLIGFAWPVEGYLHRLDPVALLGARPLPGAMAFNLVVFAIPGLLLVPVALWLYSALCVDTGFWSRVGARLVLLSALAFAAQGLVPLDINDLDGAGSRSHAVTWMGWWLAFVPGALLLATARVPARWAAMVVVPLLLVCVWLAPAWLPAGIGQRMACLLWFAWWLMAAYRMDVVRSVSTSLPVGASAKRGERG